MSLKGTVVKPTRNEKLLCNLGRIKTDILSSVVNLAGI